VVLAVSQSAIDFVRLIPYAGALPPEEQPAPDPKQLTRFVYSEPGMPQEQGGLLPEGANIPAVITAARPEATRINMLTAIRRTLDAELALNKRMLVFGEDVGPKGGVHGATLGIVGLVTPSIVDGRGAPRQGATSVDAGEAGDVWTEQPFLRTAGRRALTAFASSDAPHVECSIPPLRLALSPHASGHGT
jgi:hypothetical protein